MNSPETATLTDRVYNARAHIFSPSAGISLLGLLLLLDAIPCSVPRLASYPEVGVPRFVWEWTASRTCDSWEEATWIHKCTRHVEYSLSPVRMKLLRKKGRALTVSRMDELKLPGTCFTPRKIEHTSRRPYSKSPATSNSARLSRHTPFTSVLVVAVVATRGEARARMRTTHYKSMYQGFKGTPGHGTAGDRPRSS